MATEILRIAYDGADRFTWYCPRCVTSSYQTSGKTFTSVELAILDAEREGHSHDD